LRQTATIGKHGLLVKFPGLILHLPKAMVKEERFWVTVHQSMHKWFKVVVDTQGQDWKTFWETKMSVPQDAEPSIIMSVETLRERWEVGVLARNKGMLGQGNVRWVEILCRVWVRLETNSSIVTKLLKSVRECEGGLIFGERLKSTQRWCIDGGED